MRRAVRCLIIMAALTTLLSPATPAEAQDGCRRFAHSSGYTAVVVVVGGGGCKTLIRFRCRNDQRRTWRITSLRPLDIRTIECSPYPFRFVRALPR